MHLCVAGVPSVVQASEGDEAPVQEGVGLHEDDQTTQVPGGVRTREGHQGWQPVFGAIWQVSGFTFTNCSFVCDGEHFEMIVK